jgi:hypothetical protein
MVRRHHIPGSYEGGVLTRMVPGEWQAVCGAVSPPSGEIYRTSLEQHCARCNGESERLSPPTDQSGPARSWASWSAPQTGTKSPHAGPGGGKAVVIEGADPNDPTRTIRTVTYHGYANEDGFDPQRHRVSRLRRQPGRGSRRRRHHRHRRRMKEERLPDGQRDRQPVPAVVDRLHHL